MLTNALDTLTRHDYNLYIEFRIWFSKNLILIIA